MEFKELVAKLVRLEVENFARGVHVDVRMCDIIEHVTGWRNDKPLGKSAMMSDGDKNVNQIINYMVEMDTDAIVRGESLKNRVTQLTMYANAWVHDRAVYLRDQARY